MTAAAPPKPPPAKAIEIGPRKEPKRTLGWDILGWTAEYLLQPDGPEAGTPWNFTNEQLRFILNWYAIDRAGRFVYRYGMLRRMKGWGKDPVGAVLCCIEFIGPCRFERWAGKTPVVQSHYAAWVQVAAVSRDQTRNTMTLFPGLFSPKAVEDFGIDLGKEIIYAEKGRKRIEAVTSSPRALEGGRATFILKNEALALDTPLPTPTGWTRIGDVKAGDTLYGTSGPVSVLKVTPTFEGRQCYRLRFEDDTWLVADDGHRWRTRVNSSAKPKTRTTDEMYRDGRRFMVPLAEPLDGSPCALPVDPYVLGLWLGDGDAMAAGITTGVEDAEEIMAYVRAGGVPGARFTKTLDGAARRISLCGNEAGERYTKDGSSLRGRLDALGVLGSKHIPPRYLSASKGQRLALLQGLMDSDGCITASQEQAIFVNQNMTLARGLLELVRSLGYRSSLKSRVDRRWSKPKVIWRVVFRADERANPFRLGRKASKVKGRRRGWKSVVSIQPVASVPVRCIEVDSEDHLFLAGDGWTPTSNSHHWIAPNEGHEMAKVIARNAAKSRDGSSRVLAISNAHAPGEDSDAEHDFEAWTKIDQGISAATGILYDSSEAPETDLEDDASVMAGINAARGDSYWVSPERLLAEIRDPRTTPAMARRFYLNQIVAEEDKPFDRKRWDELVNGWALWTGRKEPAEGRLITLGFDGSENRDHTALIGTDVLTGYQWVVGYWEPVELPDGDQRIDTGSVDETVHYAFGKWQVWRMYGDPFKWSRYLSKWANEFGGEFVVSWSTILYRKMAFALAQYRVAMEGGHVTHDGDPRFAACIANAHKSMQNFRNDDGELMYVIQKERPDSPLKIDAAMAGCLSWQAREDAVADGAAVDEPVGVYFAGRAE